MTNRSLFPVLLLSCSLLGCSNDATAGGATASASARPAIAAGATSAAPAAPAPEAAAPQPELVDFSNDLIGFTIKMPKEFTTITSEDVVAAYSWGSIMVFAQTSPAPATTPDSVIVGGLEEWMTLDKKAVDLVLIEGMKPDDPRPVNVYAAPKGAMFSVHCTAPAEDKALAREICASIKAKKKKQ